MATVSEEKHAQQQLYDIAKGAGRNAELHEQFRVQWQPCRKWLLFAGGDARLCRAHADYDRFQDLVGWHMIHSEYAGPPYRWEKHTAPPS